MRRVFFLCITFFIAPITIQFAHAGEPKFLSRELLKDGWISLFDGETLFGWEPVGDAKWEVKDGEIRTTGEKPGWLMTTTRWADYTLHGEFRAAASTNSGVFLRTPLHPKDPSADCYQWSIAPDDNPFPTGSFCTGKKQSSARRSISDRTAG